MIERFPEFNFRFIDENFAKTTTRRKHNFILYFYLFNNTLSIMNVDFLRQLRSNHNSSFFFNLYSIMYTGRFIRNKVFFYI